MEVALLPQQQTSIPAPSPELAAAWAALFLIHQRLDPLQLVGEWSRWQWHRTRPFVVQPVAVTLQLIAHGSSQVGVSLIELLIDTTGPKQQPNE